MTKSPFLMLGALALVLFTPAYSYAACGFTPAGDYTCDSPAGGGAGAGTVTDPMDPGGAPISRTGVVVFNAPVSTTLTPEQVERAYNALTAAMAQIEATPGMEWVDRIEIDDDDDEDIYVPRGELYAAKVRPTVNALTPEQILAWIDNPANGGSLVSGTGTETQFMGTLIRTMPMPAYRGGSGGMQDQASGDRDLGGAQAGRARDDIQQDIDDARDAASP